jgi:hypothetical protein
VIVTGARAEFFSRNLFLAMSPILIVSSQTHDAGEQILENLVNICVPVMVVLRQIVEGIH